MGTLFANPFVSPELFDSLIIAGVGFGPFGPHVVGLFQLQDSEGRPYKWDQKDSPGTQGATITYRGSRPSTGKLKFLMWTADAIDGFFDFIAPLFQIDATKKTPKPLDVQHPVLTANDVLSIVAEKVGPLVHEGKQLYSVTIPYLEYAPAKKKNVTTTPNSSTTNANQRQGVTTVETFEDKQDAQIAALLAEAQKP